MARLEKFRDDIHALGDTKRSSGRVGSAEGTGWRAGDWVSLSICVSLFNGQFVDGAPGCTKDVGRPLREGEERRLDRLRSSVEDPLVHAEHRLWPARPLRISPRCRRIPKSARTLVEEARRSPVWPACSHVERRAAPWLTPVHELTAPDREVSIVTQQLLLSVRG